MKIFPAIDLIDGCAVRLLRGDYGKKTVYSENPLEIARDFERKGARYIHMVDLDGARNGETPNIETVKRIARKTDLFTEIGGGIRNMDTVRRYLDSGIDRVILGTAAVTDEKFLEEALLQYGERIAVGADIRDGFVSIKGWTEQSGVTLEEFTEKMENLGVKTLICTDISKDGAMAGTNRELYRRLNEETDMDIEASGGVSSLSDIKALRDMGMYGAIIGKAYYTGDIELEDAIQVAGKQD